MQRGRSISSAFFNSFIMTPETASLILGQIQAYYEEFEAQARFLSHQLNQPPQYRVFEGTTEELKEQLDTVIMQRDQYLKAWNELSPDKATLPPWQRATQENS